MTRMRVSVCVCLYSESPECGVVWSDKTKNIQSTPLFFDSHIFSCVVSRLAVMLHVCLPAKFNIFDHNLHICRLFDLSV